MGIYQINMININRTPFHLQLKRIDNIVGATLKTGTKQELNELMHTLFTLIVASALTLDMDKQTTLNWITKYFESTVKNMKEDVENH